MVVSYFFWATLYMDPDSDAKHPVYVHIQVAPKKSDKSELIILCV